MPGEDKVRGGQVERRWRKGQMARFVSDAGPKGSSGILICAC